MNLKSLGQFRNRLSFKELLKSSARKAKYDIFSVESNPAKKSKKSNLTITSPIQETPKKKSRKEKKIEDQKLTTQSINDSINSFSTLSNTIVPLKQEVSALPEIDIIKISRRGKKSKKAKEILKIDETKNIQDIDQKSMKIENIFLRSVDQENENLGMIRYDFTQENSIESYKNLFVSRKTNEVLSFKKISNVNYQSFLPIVFNASNGLYVQDINNHIYFDFASGSGSIGLGHSNREIINSALNLFETGPLSSDSFYNSSGSSLFENLKKYLGYEKINLFNTRLESLHFAINVSHKYGRNIGKNKIVVLSENLTEKFLIFDDPNVIKVKYNDISTLEGILKFENIAAVIFEPIQVEKGLLFIEEDFLIRLRTLCTEHKTLLISDESVTCLGSCSSLSFCLKKKIKPDILILGDSLAGCYCPFSIALTDTALLNQTIINELEVCFSNDPLQIKLADSSLKFLFDNPGLILNIEAKEGIFAAYLKMNNRLVKEIRGRGLFFAIELHNDSPINAYEVTLYLMERGILTMPLDNNTISLTPPITIEEEELYKACCIIVEVLKKLEDFYDFYGNDLAERTTEYDVNPINQIAMELVNKRFELIQEQGNVDDKTSLAELTKTINKL